MSADPKQARDEMVVLFLTAWDANSTSVGIPVLHDDRSDQVPSSGAWARITVRHTAGAHATLSSNAGLQRFRQTGTVFVQIFTPFDDGGDLNDDLAIIAKRAFEGQVTTPGRVIFRGVHINEVGQEGQWFQTNVLADFEYDDIH